MAALTRTTRKRALSAHTKETVVRHSTPPAAVLATAKISSAALRTSDPALVRSSPWMTFQVPRSELDLSTTLKCGQSFRWQRSHRELPSGAFSQPLFSCVLNHKLWCLEETEDGFRYRTYRSSPLSGQQLTEVTDQEIQEDRAFIHDYLQLQVPLTDLYEKWSAKDPNFKAKAPLFPGVRILRQDPVENLICFICSSNNNIGRISQMATNISKEYGSPITVAADDISDVPRTFYGFPTIEDLAQDGVEDTLRKLGFGYRAKYIAQTAKKIQAMDNGIEWLISLRNMSYEDAHVALLTLQGVGPKVADCICLMSLDKHNTIPVDTHVWQIAVRDYKFRFEGKVPKTISPAIYKAVGKHFADIFGDYAGWGHSVLFAADLKNIEGRVKIEEGDVKTEVDLSVKVKVKKEIKKEKAESTPRIKIEVPDENATPRLERHSSTMSVSQELAGIHLEDGSNSVSHKNENSGQEQGRRRQSKRRRK
ncbi:8-oxoguanine glycosylase ogg1 [Podila clonocystis]|nr:8-oxoguanine glycosylase ogg1 [Podila clonocystis]